MFWTIVAALLFVFAGIPIILAMMSTREFWILVAFVIVIMVLFVTLTSRGQSDIDNSTPVGNAETASQFFGNQ